MNLASDCRLYSFPMVSATAAGTGRNEGAAAIAVPNKNEGAAPSFLLERRRAVALRCKYLFWQRLEYGQTISVNFD